MENVELARRNTQPEPMNLSAMGSQDQNVQGNCSWCGIEGHIAGDCRKKTEYLQHNQTSGLSGMYGKGKAGTGKGTGKPGKGESNSKNGKQHGKKGFLEMEGTKTSKKHQAVKNE